uniref:Uncharacterized protein n=1 Tax=viral metagenome TaxID=1070528 RepID=A0A6C0AFW1_9ZZZZ
MKCFIKIKNIVYYSVPDKKEHFFINSYKNIYKFFKLDKLIWQGELQIIFLNYSLYFIKI